MIRIKNEIKEIDMSDEIKEINVDELEEVSGGSETSTQDTSTTKTIEFGDIKIKVETNEDLTEDDMKGANAKRYCGGLSNAMNKK